MHEKSPKHKALGFIIKYNFTKQTYKSLGELKKDLKKKFKFIFRQLQSVKVLFKKTTNSSNKKSKYLFKPL